MLLLKAKDHEYDDNGQSVAEKDLLHERKIARKVDE